MSNNLESLILELDLLAGEFIEPTDLVESGDTVVGYMTEQEKKLYTLIRLVTDEGIQTSSSLQLSSNRSDPKEVIKILYRLRAKADLLASLFYFCIRDRLHLWSEVNVSVGKDFTIIKKSPVPLGFQDIFRGMPGGS